MRGALQLEIDAFFAAAVSGRLAIERIGIGAIDWNVVADGVRYGTAVRCGEAAVVDECIRRMAERGWKKLSARLLSHGADHDDEDQEGMRARRLAAALGYELPGSPSARLAFVDYASHASSDAAVDRRRFAATVSEIKRATEAEGAPYACAVQ